MKIEKKLLSYTIIFVLCFYLIGCGSKEDATAFNQDEFNNQNASVSQNQTVDADEISIEDSGEQATAEPGDTITQDNITDAEEGVNVENNTEILFEASSETVFATSNVNIRRDYKIEEGNVVAVLKKGESVKRIGISEEWSKILYRDNTYYIMSNYLTLQAPIIEITPTPVIDAISPTPTITVTASPSPSATPTEEITPSPAPTPSPDATPSPAPTPKISVTPSPSVTPTVAPSSEESFVSELAIPSNINQLVCVLGNGGSDCTVSFHKKDSNGNWVQQFSTDGDCGSGGITNNKKEGDKKTPAGLYSFTLAFGLMPDPGSLLTYRRITEYDYWIDDVDSPYYNTWINSKEKPGNYESEHLIEHNPSYNYALNINYNPSCTPGLGSAVFLHCYNGTGYTTGCIAISEEYMKTLIEDVDSSTMILIVPPINN